MNDGVSITEKRTTRNVRHDGNGTYAVRTSHSNADGSGARLRVQQLPVQPGAPVPGDAGQIVMPRGGLQLARQLPFESWLRIGRQLSSVVHTSSWCLGDWLAYGEAAYSGRYRDAVEQTSLDYQTLRNYAWVAKRFPMSRRRDSLSFGHHAEVAALTDHEQDFWLRKAQELGWSRNHLRRELRASLREQKATRPASDDDKCGDPVVGSAPGHDPYSASMESPRGLSAADRGPSAGSAHRLELSLTSEQITLCREAASKEGLPVDDWALQVLSHAASDSLQTAGKLPGGEFCRVREKLVIY